MPSTSSPDSKTELRKRARIARAQLRHDAFGAALAAQAAALKIAPHSVVAGYRARDDEADPALLLQTLAGMDARIAFPRVAAKHAPLEFHLVPEDEALRPGAYGIHEPHREWPRVTPDIVLVPLLAYDDHGHRLGYGGGYYDRTLAALPRARAIGIAYAGQRMDFLPHGAHDYPLDAILTENGLTPFPR